MGEFDTGTITVMDGDGNTNVSMAILTRMVLMMRMAIMTMSATTMRLTIMSSMLTMERVVIIMTKLQQ